MYATCNVHVYYIHSITNIVYKRSQNLIKGLSTVTVHYNGNIKCKVILCYQKEIYTCVTMRITPADGDIRHLISFTKCTRILKLNADVGNKVDWLNIPHIHGMCNNFLF